MPDWRFPMILMQKGRQSPEYPVQPGVMKAGPNTTKSFNIESMSPPHWEKSDQNSIGILCYFIEYVPVAVHDWLHVDGGEFDDALLSSRVAS